MVNLGPLCIWSVEQASEEVSSVIEESIIQPPQLQTKFPGVYRGIVKQNDDRPTDDGGQAEDEYGPLGRLRVLVPQVYGENVQEADLPWAWPCFPFGGTKKDQKPEGLVSIPRVGAQVWVMFEQGDMQSPVWLGTCYGAPASNNEETELPDACRDPEEEEKNRTGTEYPELTVWQGQSKAGDAKSMMIRFVSDKRIDIYLDKDNYIELDSSGNSPENEPPQIRVHSKDYRVKVDSDVQVVLTSPTIVAQAVTEEGTGNITLQADTVQIVGGQRVVVSSGTILGSGGVAGAFYHPPKGGHPPAG